MNEEWVVLGTLNQLSFTGLPWGDYELMIRASRNNQDWSPVRSLLISIQAPPCYNGMPLCFMWRWLWG